jgi:UDP-N-acetylmuramoylalanine--D-glutamate ligase
MGMDLEGQNVLVVGLARSGLAVAKFLQVHGALVTITDQATESGLGNFVQQARQLNVTLELGGHRDQMFACADLIVISPGVPHTLAQLAVARQRGVPVIGEVELASRFIQIPIVAVTGTNGKTTTTELLGSMLAASGLRVFVGGNIGNPLIEIADSRAQLDVIVAEVSSFQLDTVDTFRPHVAVLLNISPDHLDRYPSLEAYADSKGRIFANQGANDFAVCHGNDELVSQQCRNTAAGRLNFFSKPPENGQLGQGAIITPRQIAYLVPEGKLGRIDLNRTSLFGPHNRENIAAACLAAFAVGASEQGVQGALDAFKPPAHRLEPVGIVRGVEFINDSKATNVNAVMRALECFSRPVVLIMGGRNKGYDFNALDAHVRKNVRKLIVIGEAAEEILSALGNVPDQGAERASDLDQAVRNAFNDAKTGETVLLSPACASFDMFGSYAERGERFRQLVGGLS